MTNNRTMMFGGTDVCTLADKFGTPLYVYDYQVISNNIQTVVNDVLHRHPNTKAYYAAKAFLTLAMADIISQSPLGIDVASRGELYIALKGNILPSNILYHGNNKSYQDLQYAVSQGVGRIVVDSIRELHNLATITDHLQQPIRVLLRFSPKLHRIQTHKNIQTGHRSSKFGLDLDQTLDQAISIIQSHKYLNFVGFHFHVGSQLLTNRHHLEAVEEVFAHIVRLHEAYHITCEELDIGGGFAIPYTSGQTAISLVAFLDPVMKRIETLTHHHALPPIHVSIEPGRWIVGPAAITLYRVGTIKPSTNHLIAAIDGGMTDNLRVALYQASYEAVVANKMDQPSSTTYQIVGNACESTDIMIESIALPTLEEGDILAVRNTGAYEHSLANNFNKTLRPAVVLLEDTNITLIQTREELSDLITRDQHYIK